MKTGTLLKKKTTSFNDSDTGEAQDPGLDTAWDIVMAGFVIVSIMFGTYYCYAVFLIPMKEDLGWSRMMLSGVISLYMICHGFFGVIMGNLSDRYGPRWIAAISVVFVALGYCLIATVTTPLSLYIYFGIVVGIGMGGAYVPPISTVTKWFTIRSGIALGIVMAGVGVGQILMPPLIRYLINIYGWRNSFFIMGLIVLVIGFPAAMFLRRPPMKPEPESNIKENLNQDHDYSVMEAIRTPSFFILLSLFIALVFGVIIIMTHLVSHVIDCGFDKVAAAFVVTIIGASGIVGRIIMGGFSDRFGTKMSLPLCLLLQAILLFNLVVFKSLGSFYLIAALYGLGYGGTLPIIIKMSSEFYGITSSGTILGILIFGATSVGALGAPLAGRIYDVTGNYSIAFLIGGIVLSMAVIMSLFLNGPKKKQILQ